MSALAMRASGVGPEGAGLVAHWLVRALSKAISALHRVRECRPAQRLVEV
jgi:hypothetical protein